MTTTTQSTDIKSYSYGKLFASYLGPQRGRVAFLALLVLLSIALQLANPQIIRYFLDTVESGGQLRQLLGAAAIYMVVTIFQQVIMLGATYVGEVVGWTATNWLRADLARHCLRLDMSFHKVHTPGELIERVDGDVNQLANFFSRMILMLAGNLLLFIGVGALLWWESWQMGVAISLVAIISISVINYLRRLITPRWEKLRAADADLFGFLEERLGGTEDIQTSGAKPYVMLGLYKLLYQRWEAAKDALKIDAWMVPMPIWVFGLAYAAGHFVSGRLFLEGQMSIGSVYLIFAYIALAEGPLWRIMDMVDQLQRAVAAINRITKLLAVQPTLHDGPGVEVPEGPLAVEFDHVSFQYEDVEPLSLSDPDNTEKATAVDTVLEGEAEAEQEPAEVVISDISFRLEPGKILGLLGRTGSGKSTLSKLLYRFYDPNVGHIRLGMPGSMFDLQAAQRSDLHGRIGMVTQDVQLFHATVRDNLTLFDDSISDERILAVLAQVGLLGWVEELEQGLDSEMSGNDSSLSAGEAQLLAFTRVFLADPGLVILDEASSRLDPATEQQIEIALDQLLAGRTSIIIAHRLATIQRADQILILENGQVAEHGDRTALAADPHSRFYELLRTGELAVDSEQLTVNS